MATQFGNRVRFISPTVGSGTLSVGAAVAGYLTPAQAGIASGSTVGYVIEDGDVFEVGTGIYTTGTPATVSRDVVEKSTTGGTKILASGSASVSFTATAAQLTALLSPGNTAPLMDGIATAGTGTTWARNDHVHPTDTTRQTAAQVTAAINAAAASTAPLMDGIATAGTGTTWARNDHVHPSMTTLPTLTVSGLTTLGGAVSLNKTYSTALAFGSYQTHTVATLTVPAINQLWNNFDDFIYNVPGGDNSPLSAVVTRYIQFQKHCDSPLVPSWPLIVSNVDFTNHRSSIAGPVIGQELNIEVSSLDDHSGAFGASGSRTILAVNGYRGRGYAGTDTQIGHAITVYSDPAQLTFKRVFTAATAWSDSAFSSNGGIQRPGAKTIKLSAGHILDWTGNGNDMFWDVDASGGAALHLVGSMQVDGLLYVPNNITVGGGATLAGGAIIAGLTTTGANADKSADVFVATTAGTRTIPNNCSWECLNPAAEIAAFTLTMPAAPVDGHDLWISTSQNIFRLTLTPNTGQTVANAPVTLSAGASLHYRYSLAATTWLRLDRPARESYKPIYSDLTTTGNGADTTEDTLKTFAIPAGTLLNVGDRLHIVAGGQLGGTTDSRQVRLRFGGTLMGFQISTTAGQISWRAEFDIFKSGANTQRCAGAFINNNASTGTALSSAFTDTAPITLLLSGQNNTSSVAGSIDCRVFVVDYLPYTA